MRNRVLVPALAAAILGVVAWLALPAFAWSATVDGSSSCVDGKATIDWSVTNSEANNTMTITSSNNTAVPVGSTVAGGATAHYTQVVAGPGAYSLDIAVSWSNSEETANPPAKVVNVEGECTPTPPPPTNTPPASPPAVTPPHEAPPAHAPGAPVPDTGA